MRGKLAQEVQKANPERITPADAGKTKRYNNCVNHAKDHPRGCGENYAEKVCVPAIAGSPPRMRGKPKKSSLS